MKKTVKINEEEKKDIKYLSSKMSIYRQLYYFYQTAEMFQQAYEIFREFDNHFEALSKKYKIKNAKVIFEENTITGEDRPLMKQLDTLPEKKLESLKKFFYGTSFFHYLLKGFIEEKLFNDLLNKKIHYQKNLDNELEELIRKYKIDFETDLEEGIVLVAQ